MLRLLTCLFTVFAVLPALGQEGPRAILVLDGSGSMWGQIDGINKITIAQDVVIDLLQTLPEDQVLGLTAYGHRREGDCNDIETLVAPGAGTRDEMAAAVRSLRPKGKTPMTDAVIAAANALRYTEEKATVILVSDGVETCNPDPCAAARALEEAGADFTAHVVGFATTEAKALEQMRCLAEETGGTFLTAQDADELGAALAVVAEPEPEPVPVRVTFIATLGEGGPQITDGLVWDLGRAADGPWIAQGQASPGIAVEAVPGTELYVRVDRPEDDAMAELALVAPDEAGQIALVLPELPPQPVPTRLRATLGENGPEITEGLVWFVTGPEGSVEDGRRDPSFTLPLLSGDYGARVLRLEDEAVAEASFTVDEAEQTVTLVLPEIARTAEIAGPATAVAGSTVPVTWTAEAERDDYITVVPSGSPDNTAGPYRYTRDGNPSELRLPLDPGAYELRYVGAGPTDRVLARQPIEITPVTATLEAPAEAIVGSDLPVSFEGPAYHGDYITVARTDDAVTDYVNYGWVNQGSPVPVAMPLEPGTYELRYVADGTPSKVLATRPVTIVETLVTLDAAPEAVAGAVVPVTWTGPDNRGDYIAVAEPGADDARYVNYAYTGNGSPAAVTMPLDPGTYELRYVANGSPDQVLATRPITIIAASVVLSAPEAAEAGSPVTVDWTGPDNPGDYISVAAAGADSNRYVNYAYTARGNPALVSMPLDAGAYELRYVANGSPDEVLASRPITVTAPEVSLNAPGSAVAGSTVSVTWTGPDNQGDYIAAAKTGEADNRYDTYVYTNRGSPGALQLPVTAGDYEIRYIANGSPDKVLARQPITVAPVTATLDAPASAPAGGTVTVTWDGPDYQNDYIGIGAAGTDRYDSYSYTRNGSPAEIKVPDSPGAYEIRYYLNQGGTIIATRPLTVE